MAFVKESALESQPLTGRHRGVEDDLRWQLDAIFEQEKYLSGLLTSKSRKPTAIG